MSDGSKSESDESRSLDWIDRPNRELLGLAWPIAVSYVSYAVMTLVDTLFVGRLGAAALAGVGLGGVIAFGLTGFGFGLLRGVKVNVSQAVGAGRRAEAVTYLGAGLLLALGLGLLGAALGQGVADLLPRISASPASGMHAHDYLAIRMLGAPCVLIFVACREHRYGISDARSPMWAAVAANVVNVGLDWLLIVHLDMGVRGAAWASVAGHAVECVVLLLVQRRGGFGLRRARLRHVAAVWHVGLPTGLQFLLEIGSFSLMSLMLAALSDVQMAAHQIAIQVVHFGFLPTAAVAEASSVMAGQAVGARRDELVRFVALRALALAGSYALLFTGFLVLAAPWLVARFTSDAALLPVAATLLYVAAVFQLTDAAQVVAGSALRGTGDVRYAAVLGVVTAWLCTPPLTWLLGYRAGLGAMGGWIGLSLELGILSILLWRRLWRGGWRAAAGQVRARREAIESADRVSLAPAE